MAFLYSSYIIINAVMSSVLGSVIDNDFTQNKNIIYSLKTVGGYGYYLFYYARMPNKCYVLGLTSLSPQL